jgi:hypothetical protein
MSWGPSGLKSARLPQLDDGASPRRKGRITRIPEDSGRVRVCVRRGQGERTEVDHPAIHDHVRPVRLTPHCRHRRIDVSNEEKDKRESPVPPRGVNTISIRAGPASSYPCVHRRLPVVE